MVNDKIGVATSIFKEKNFDSFSTIEYASSNNIKTIQLYLHDDLEKQHAMIDRIRQLLIEGELHMLCHSKHYLNKDLIDDGRHIAALNILFPKNQKKLVVVHYDEECPVNEAINVIKMLNRNGITACIENFHRSREKKALIKNINNFNKLITVASENNLDFLPVIDIPRLFVEEFVPYNSLFLSELLLHNISVTKKEMILHLVDFTDNKQQREDWIEIGKGLMPYDELFEYIKEYDITVPHAILEFESLDLAEKSLQPLSQLLDTLA